MLLRFVLLFASSLRNEVEIVIEMLSIGGGSLETWKWGKSWTFLGKYGKLEEEESCLAKCYRIDPFEFGSGSRRNGEREIGNEFSLLIVVTFKIHGIQFQS